MNFVSRRKNRRRVNQHGSSIEEGIESTSFNISSRSFKFPDSNNGEPEEETEEDDIFERMETEAGFDHTTNSFSSKSGCLNGVKWIFVISLLIIGAVVSTTAFIYTSRQQQRRFQEQFEDDAMQYINAFYQMRSTQIWAAYTIAALFINQAEDQNKFSSLDWPNITLPNFGAKALGSLHLITGDSLFFCPFVPRAQRSSWEQYAVQNQVAAEVNGTLYGRSVEDGIFQLSNGTLKYDFPPVGRNLVPIWQLAPFSKRQLIMLDINSLKEAQTAIALAGITGGPQTSAILNEESDSFFREKDTSFSPRSLHLMPVPARHLSKNVVGVVAVVMDFKTLLGKVINTEGAVTVIVRNTCGQFATFRIEKQTAHYVADRDLHDEKYDDLGKQTTSDGFVNFFGEGLKEDPFNFRDRKFDKYRDESVLRGIGACFYNIDVYPTQQYEEMYKDYSPLVYMLVSALFFVFASLLFFFYDTLVEKRQKMVMSSAAKSEAIVRSLFPKNIRERLFGATKHKAHDSDQQFFSITAKNRLTNFLNSSSTSETSFIREADSLDAEPIADLFPNTTVMFADIAGFTAWSSEREPPQVFKLLETIYHSFDVIARRLGVFKVETIGDCYVAVAGLPEPNKDHAIVMAKFAHEILVQMTNSTRQLEKILGPGTSDLALRVGLHSGPVTAGVLRGEKYRFQLFGDTMNVASRMESTGRPHRIQVSEATAELINQGGNQAWLSPRGELVTAKGKGEVKTYWLRIYNGTKRRSMLDCPSSVGSVDSWSTGEEEEQRSLESKKWGQINMDDSLSSRVSVSVKEDRLIDWNTEVLTRLLGKVVQYRLEIEGRQRRLKTPTQVITSTAIIDEVSEVMTLPEFNPKMAKLLGDKDSTHHLPIEVKDQLREYVAEIAARYRRCAFHNFEHASHVTMSANKLIKRIIHPDDLDTTASDVETVKGKRRAYASDLHYSTFGISSDPLTQFSVVFSALIHDVGHTGVPNAQLVKEKLPIAVRYGNQSVAEQNSVVVAWDLLMEPRFEDLQTCIFSNEETGKRFRQLVVNAVMATDIMDKDMLKLRKNRWERAFSSEQPSTGKEDINRKATIVIDHIIQASDIAHTMQHWHIYTKWNERLFCEMRQAYFEGRADKDPALNWFEGEIGFFDHYIIPLAKKLKECGVFGVSSDEYLGFALENRNEWERKGREVVQEMINNHPKEIRHTLSGLDSKMFT